MYFNTKVVSAFFCMFILTNVFAEELHVDIQNDNCDDIGGLPYCSISAALSSAIEGDIVTVNPGIYFENVSFSGKNVYLRSSSGPNVTEINGEGATTVVIGPDGHIEGFKITGGVASFGAGMDVIGTGALIKSNIFEGNIQTSGGYGAAIGGNSASATIDGNVFRNNSCDSQFLSGTVSFVNSSSPLIINNLFIDNPCRGTNMTLPTNGRPEVYNNIFIGNRTGIYFDRRVSTAGHRYINNIVYSNKIGVEVNFGSAANNPFFRNNIVHANSSDYSGINDQTGLDGNLSSDPMFADISSNDYRLRVNSPAIDAGFEQDILETDFLNNNRPMDGNGDMVAVADIGAYEAIFPASNAGEDITVNPSTSVSLSATESFDDDGTIVEFIWEQTEGEGVDLVNSYTATPNFVAPANSGNLVFQVTVVDDLGFTSVDEINVRISMPPSDIQESSSGGGGSVGLFLVFGLLLNLIHKKYRQNIM